MGLISRIFGRLGTGSTHAPQAAPPDITSESEEDGFVDLVLAIDKHDVRPGGTQSFRASGVHQGQRVALEILLGPDWRAGSLGEDIPQTTYSGQVTYRSVGPESDALLRAIDALYETQLEPRSMTGERHFTCVTLGGDPRHPHNGRIHAKLFYETDNEDEYAELYTNIDVAAGRVEIKEKDPDYRSAIVRALRAT